ncbi:MAG: tRNA preQ1(34) S-adenosylmethionine ribosyltransferase-isomerase QueA [Planctomycetota bacterium]
MNLSDFDFELPDALIAQAPVTPRDASRLLVLRRDQAALEHRVFRDLPELLRPTDLLVLNETAVFPARLLAKRAKTGGKVEVLLLEPLAEPGVWEALVRSKSTPAPGERLELGGSDHLLYDAPLGEGRGRVRFPEGSSPFELAQKRGHIPLPPYIRDAEDTAEDKERYQTVYAREPGAVAAPTAGLHFTPELLAKLGGKGIEVARLVLHVGIGTFLPVRAAKVEEHKMHAERYSIPEATLRALEKARAEGRRVVACGTTTVRALESFAASGQSSGATSIFIYPPYEFRIVGGMITNFHLPKSTLLMLVSALAGRERVLEAYREAVREKYRFYSYGDAMLIV